MATKKPRPVRTTMSDTSQATTDRCPMCGKEVAKRPRCAKLRFRHKCPHGKWCGQGEKLVGAHSFAPRHSPNCEKCRALPDNAFRAVRMSL